MHPPIARIPVVLLTGFLGSGKTTLLRALLQLPQSRDTAVLINELGAVGLDHHLAWGAADTTVVLENGCVCCSVQSDLAAALEDLFWKRLHRKIPRFERVVIETTGIADPGRIMNLFSAQSLVAERYVLSSVLCTVDGIAGGQQLLQHAECLAQAAVADAIVITKTDIAEEADLARLELQLNRVNPVAARRRSTAGAETAAMLFDVFTDATAGTSRSATRTPDVPSGSAYRKVAGAQMLGPMRPTGVHSQMSSFVLRLKKFRDRSELEATLGTVLSGFGTRILRIKGLVEVNGDCLPTVVQAVGDRLFPFEQLPVGARLDGSGFLVFITVGMRQEEFLRSGLLASSQLASPT